MTRDPDRQRPKAQREKVMGHVVLRATVGSGKDTVQIQGHRGRGGHIGSWKQCRTWLLREGQQQPRGGWEGAPVPTAWSVGLELSPHPSCWRRLEKFKTWGPFIPLKLLGSSPPAEVPSLPTESVTCVP